VCVCVCVFVPAERTAHRVNTAENITSGSEVIYSAEALFILNSSTQTTQCFVGRDVRAVYSFVTASCRSFVDCSVAETCYSKELQHVLQHVLRCVLLGSSIARPFLQSRVCVCVLACLI